MRKIFFIKWFTAVALCFPFWALAQAGVDPPVIKVLDGSLDKIKVDSSITVQDAKYYDNAYASLLKTSYRTESIVSFEINEGLPLHMPEAFTARVGLQIAYKRAENSPDSVVNTQLDVNYHPAGSYANKAVYIKTGFYRVTVKITSKTSSVGWNAWKFLKVVNLLQSYPEYNFTYNGNRIGQLRDSAWTPGDNKDELPVWWTPSIGAGEYDLEWAYIDSSAFASGRYDSGSLHPHPGRVFANNASRVSITGTSYRIPLIYDSKGHLFYRVRAVQLQKNGARYEAAWTTANTAGSGRFDFNGHERTFNWQATTTFAEEGKRKSVVQYYDGSLRGRQTVTKDNTTNRTIVAESFYDYQGRPVIQVLPAPTLNTIIGYTQNFNRGLNTGAYDKNKFDSLADPGLYCAIQAAPMDSISGASQYYSSLNPYKDSGVHKYVPRAGGYPFTETEYTQDNTGRINRQSGVGADFALGSGHETKYFYATPDQRELDALFGTEVGDRSHYFKNLVRDANGQYSISYVDMHGRTIATALAGNPDPSLQKLPSNTSASRIETLADPNSVVIKDHVMEHKKSLIVTTAGNREFTYNLNPLLLKEAGCNMDSICYDCLYDLRITITDDCNNQHLGGKAFDTVVRNFTLDAIDTTCNTSAGFSFTFNKWLPEGNYEITKSLSVSRYAMDYYRDSIFMAVNNCKTFDQFIIEQRALQTQMGDCKTPCEDCGNEMLSIRQSMLLDMTPSSGQYANIDQLQDRYSIFYYRVDSSGDNRITDTLPAYTKITTYRDADGNPDFVFDEGAGKLVPPQDLPAALFAQRFKASWADTLLRLHPEYCKLTRYEQLAASHAWDKKFEAVDSYAAARDSGYLNPTNLAGDFATWFGTPGSRIDPLFAYYSSLSDTLKIYRKIEDIPPGNTKDTLSLWSLATLTVMCPGESNKTTCIDQYKTNDKAFNPSLMCEAELDMAWRTFRQLYLEAKHALVNKWVRDGCTSSMTAAQIIATGHSPHFTDATEMRSLTMSADLPSSQAEASVFVQQQYEDNCKAYATKWLQDLAPCRLYNPADLNVIIPNLVAICKEGSDLSHPYGSSSVKPSSTNAPQFRSFEAYLKYFNTSKGYVDSLGNCNAYAINVPKPYDQQAALGNKPLYQKPDNCECSNISLLYGKYLPKSSRYGSFSNYLRDVYKTNVADSVLTTLLGLCGVQSFPAPDCDFVSKPVFLPPVFQCYTNNVCVDCERFTQLNTEFRQLFPSVRPADADTLITDSVQLRWNQVYEQFMNYRLGYAKTIGEYLLFGAQCTGNAYGTERDRLQQIVAGFKSSQQQTRGIGTSWDALNIRTYTSLPDIVQNGTLILPDSVRAIPSGWYNNVGLKVNGGRVICASTGYALELRMRYLDDSKMGDLFYIDMANISVTFGRYPEGVCLMRVQGLYGLSQTFSPRILAVSGGASSWFTIKIKIAPSAYYVYGNGVLIKEVARDPANSIVPVIGMVVGLFGRTANIDWIKLYDGSDQVKYFEDYLNPYNPVLPAADFVCAAPPDCTTAFTQYFNQQNSTNYTYSQVQALYGAAGVQLAVCGGETVATRCDTLTAWLNDFKKNNSTPNADTAACKADFVDYFNQLNNSAFTYDAIAGLYDGCGVVLNPCLDPDLMLCGRTEPVFPPMALEAIDNCSDSTFFITSTAQDLHRRYLDSLKGTFDSRYLARCMQAYKYEKFTVRHIVSEYHYTLYYYDQAGNLIKTIPPAGVRPNYDSLWLDSVSTARRAGLVKVPAHQLPTQYRYNTLNQVTTQKSPDGGKTEFWYDRLGRLALSRNNRQKVMSDAGNHYFSYTKYDVLGRITEVGQLRDTLNQAITDTFTRAETALTAWYTSLLKNREQVTNTVYDTVYLGFTGIDPKMVVAQQNVRNRVSYVTYTDTPGLSTSYDHGSFYSYDIHGNVDTLLQDYGQSATRPNIMNKNGNRWKKLVYEYDLISGKVNMVKYQPGYADQWLHRYYYDAENRLTEVETSSDGYVWEREAKYEYYLHGPLARTIIGQQQVQGMDYAYTLQGWLKGVNSTGSTATYDIGGDGKAGSINQYVGRDALGFNLNYFLGDYKAIDAASNATFPTYKWSGGGLPDSMYRPLYNGNISGMATNLRMFQGHLPILYNYKYDQLNRLVSQNAYYNFDATTNSYRDNWDFNYTFHERMSYDANGNIQTTVRHALAATGPALMDSLFYKYYAGTNQLRQVIDHVPDNSYGANAGSIQDIDSQTDTSNYAYDSIGNLIRDKKEGITNVKWNVYGKITEINRTVTPRNNVVKLVYNYDAQGNRIGKVEYQNSGVRFYTWYARDAQGNLMSTYAAVDSFIAAAPNKLDTLVLSRTERQVYGSSRLGVYGYSASMDKGPNSIEFYTSGQYERGWRQYELTNHLGNVLTTISDRKIGVYSGGSLTIGDSIYAAASYYEPAMISATDYYPFGMVSRARLASDLGQPNYRHGFNGKENDNEVKGYGNQVDFGGRIYDPRVGKFFSVDPMSRSYPSESNYSYAGNSPVMLTDFNGYFKISPLFVQRYPTLARILEHYLPLLKDNPQIKAAWIRTVGFTNQAEGEKAFDDMVTYGQGPWITPTRELSELKDPSNTQLGGSRFYEPNSYEGGWAELPADYVNNLAISHYRVDELEAALKKGDANEIGRNMFIVSSIIMHEASHWGKWKYNCCEVDDSRYEKGSVFEFEAFGQRFTNKHNSNSPFDENLAKSYYDKEKGGYGSPTFGLSINILNGKNNYWRMIKVGHLLPGQIGDPTIRDNKDNEELSKPLSKPYQQKDRKSPSDKNKTTY